MSGGAGVEVADIGNPNLARRSAQVTHRPVCGAHEGVRRVLSKHGSMETLCPTPSLHPGCTLCAVPAALPQGIVGSAWMVKVRG